MILGKLINFDCIFGVVKLSLILLLIFPASGRNRIRRQSKARERVVRGSMSRDFDHHSNFNTRPPLGPPTSSAYGSTKEVTSILRSTVSRPGLHESEAKQELNGKPSDLILPDILPVSPSPSNPGQGACQYIVTFNKSPHCAQKDATISLATGGHTPVTVTRAQLDDYEMRIEKLEEVIHALSDSLPNSNDSPDSLNEESSKSSAGKSNMRTIMQEMKDQLVLLEHGLADLQDEKDSLKQENRNLINALRRASIARKNLVGIKMELERNLKRQKEEIATLSLVNRTLTLQNTQLKGNYRNLESLKDSYRNRNSALEEEKTQLTEEVEGCKSERLGLSDENASLKIRVKNLTAVVDDFMKDSTDHGALKIDLENEREKNEILVSRNRKLVEKLENATRQIREMEVQISDANKMNKLAEDHIGSKFTTIETADDSPPTTTKDFTTCGRILSISEPETIRGSRNPLERYGVWMMDPLGALGAGKIWWINTAKERVKEVKQYSNLRKMQLGEAENTITLTTPIESTGGVVYNGSLYYQRRNSRKLVRYDIRAKRSLIERPVHHAGFHGMYAYQWGGFTDIDLAVDEYGLWVIYSTRQNKGNIVLSRLNPVTLKTTSTIRTPIPKRRVANAFMACGILYTVDRYNTENASLNLAFNPKTKKIRRITIPFVNSYRYNVMIDYNPGTREIFAWDNSHQVKYSVEIDQSFGEITL